MSVYVAPVVREWAEGVAEGFGRSGDDECIWQLVNSSEGRHRQDSQAFSAVVSMFADANRILGPVEPLKRKGRWFR